MYNGINKLNWDYEVSGADPFEDAKYIIEIGMSVADEFVPVLGTVIGGLLELFFPSHQRKREDVWRRAIEEIEKHVDQKIDELTFNTMQAEVTALGQSFRDFTEAIKNASPETIRVKFQILDDHHAHLLSILQNDNFKVLLLPFFGMVSNLHGALMRTCILNSEAWEWPAKDMVSFRQQFEKRFIEYDHYMSASVGEYLRSSELKAPPAGKHGILHYNYMAAARAYTTEKVDDFRVILSYMSPFTHPEAKTIIPPEMFQDIYSIAYGTADDGGYVGITYSRPLANMTEIEIGFHLWDLRLNIPTNFNIHYPHAMGPLQWENGAPTEQRADTTGLPPMKDNIVDPKIIAVPKAKEGNIFSVDKVIVRPGNIIEGLSFICGDEPEVVIWDRAGYTARTEVSFDHRRLSSIAFVSRSAFYHSEVACLIFGFSKDKSRGSKNIRELLYLILPEENPSIVEIAPELQRKRRNYHG